jgi:hypothetical protein
MMVGLALWCFCNSNIVTIIIFLAISLCFFLFSRSDHCHQQTPWSRMAASMGTLWEFDTPGGSFLDSRFDSMVHLHMFFALRNAL